MIWREKFEYLKFWFWFFFINFGYRDLHIFKIWFISLPVFPGKLLFCWFPRKMLSRQKLAKPYLVVQTNNHWTFQGIRNHSFSWLLIKLTLKCDFHFVNSIFFLSLVRHFEKFQIDNFWKIDKFLVFLVVNQIRKT